MSDELTQRLRELAETAATPPPVTGAEVRATAVRRRRRRHTTATVAGACAAATLAVFLTLHLTPDGTEHRRSPSASLAPT
ncbi:murein L,D-transpeptidase, partial [Streptomyces ipomoeae]|nr:murein L,D-transpeptidase [Streptomyces ipomoeae]